MNIWAFGFGFLKWKIPNLVLTAAEREMSMLITYMPVAPSSQCRKTIMVWKICSSFALREKKKSLFKDNYCLRTCYKNTNGFFFSFKILFNIHNLLHQRKVHIPAYLSKVGLVNNRYCSTWEVQKALVRIRVIIIISIIILFLLKLWNKLN